MAPSYSELTDAEREWINGQMQAATEFVARHSPADAAGPLTLPGLDRAFAAWLALGVTDSQAINEAINAVGVAFGSFLVRDGGFSWVIAQDEHGTDLATLALPDTANFLVYPANFVAKRWERKQVDFIESSFRQIVADTKVAQAQWDAGTAAKGKTKQHWWKR